MLPTKNIIVMLLLLCMQVPMFRDPEFEIVEVVRNDGSVDGEKGRLSPAHTKELKRMLMTGHHEQVKAFVKYRLTIKDRQGTQTVFIMPKSFKLNDRTYIVKDGLVSFIDRHWLPADSATP